MAQIDEITQARLEKLQALQNLGINPYPSVFEKKNSVAEALKGEGGRIKTAGKILSIRSHGEISFLDIKDETGRIQLFFKKDVVGEDEYRKLELLDIGDIIGVEGAVGKTTAGEISIIPDSFTLLSKTLLPLPHEWYGLKDIETRYRKRYLDLIMNDDIKNIFLTRTRIIQLIRDFLTEKGFLEVETPVLQPIYGGASAKPFTTHHNALDTDLYLRISDELYLKRLIIGGFEKVFEIGKDFRNEGLSKAHNPEFTQVEFYWAYADYNNLMDFTEDIIKHVVEKISGGMKVVFEDQEYDFEPTWERLTYKDMIKKYLDIDIDECKDETSLLKKAQEIKLIDEDIIGYGNILDKLFKQHIRPQLRGPLFLIDHPIELKPLAKRKENDPTKAASFQLLIAGEEMVNAYNELNDPIDQKNRWTEEAKLAERGGEDYQVFDEDYIEALSYGMPPTAGWGLGIDRLTAFLTGQHAIKDVILFPTMRPEHDGKESSEKHEKQKLHDLGKYVEAENEKKQVNNTTRRVQAFTTTLTREDAMNILEEHLENKNLINHCKAVEAAMGSLARKLFGDEKLWRLAGLLHDADWEATKDSPNEHTHKTIEWIKAKGESNQELIDCILSHNNKHNGFREPQTTMEWALYCCDDLTGFIVAVALIRPDKKLGSVDTESVLKKFPISAFARQVNRGQIALCEEKLSIPIEEFTDIVLKSLKDISDELGL